MFSYSFTDWDGLSPDRQFVGLDNYVELFTRPELFEVFFVSLYYMAPRSCRWCWPCTSRPC